MRQGRLFTHFAVSAALMATGAVGAWAQTFSSGSTGVDGALNITTPGNVIFDPAALGIDMDGDNIFHFTTVKIGPQTHLIFKASKMRRPGPVVFLATGEVEINGWMDLDGAPGHPYTASDSVRRPSEPGPGGFPGGAGAKGGGQPQPGSGPGGALIPISGLQYSHVGCSASHASAGLQAGNTSTLPRCAGKIPDTYGSSLLLPLIGGSGASGGFQGTDGSSAGGGAGGGAIRITSSVAIRLRPAASLTIAPQISARGGAGAAAAGSGGAIHLQAPIVEINQRGGDGTCCYQGQVNASGALNANSAGDWGTSGDGRIRIDSTTRILDNYLINPLSADGPLKNEPLPVNVPRVRISSIDGQNIAETAGGAYPIADVTLDNLNSIQIQVAASYVPVGTSVTLFISTEASGANQTVTTTPLTGTLASSTASATITLPRGVTVLYVRATW